MIIWFDGWCQCCLHSRADNGTIIGVLTSCRTGLLSTEGQTTDVDHGNNTTTTHKNKNKTKNNDRQTAAPAAHRTLLSKPLTSLVLILGGTGTVTGEGTTSKCSYTHTHTPSGQYEQTFLSLGEGSREFNRGHYTYTPELIIISGWLADHKPSSISSWNISKSMINFFFIDTTFHKLLSIFYLIHMQMEF